MVFSATHKTTPVTHKSNQRVFIPILPTSQDVMSQNLEVGPKAYGNSKNENSCDESFEIGWIRIKKMCKILTCTPGNESISQLGNRRSSSKVPSERRYGS